eukprot:CAMPEP_0114349980 /NCGR_PEP_ID=MMETSP0101-20121206/15973_1 /TAXON_ID=38822 ORGANISM="Pteridomonas danica, Strain PT" /NCGR_SAMPLE_ID=MMETSP0101 /ASSEMBLY_ACC=CAM_ASM_000211 /LENGTH=410 /DNA_ID=CAMNT_0001488893 /DNA_START=22 /DNA_END=1254 /DNA_ORIENTATION=-
MALRCTMPVARCLPKTAFSTLAEEFPMSGAVGAAVAVSDVVTSVLSNGIKVVSKETGSGAATVGVAVNAGARHSSQGEALLLKHLAFKGTASQSDIKLARELEAAGLTVDCVADRDAIVYSASGMKNEVMSTGLDAVAESSLTPKFNDWHVQEMKGEAMAVEVQFAASDPLSLLTEKIHEAAYGKSAALGRPALKESSADTAGVVAYHGEHFNTANMTVVGTGVAHSELVAAAEKAFGGARKGEAVVGDKTEFVGGFAYNDACRESHVAVAFNGPATGSAEYLDSLVLHEIWSQGAAQFGGAAFNHSYRDAGLLGVRGSNTEDVVALLKAPISEAAVATAKIAVKTQLAHSAECAASLFPLLVNGAIPNVDNVNASKVNALASKLTKSAPALASVGSQDVPAYNTLAKMF